MSATTANANTAPAQTPVTPHAEKTKTASSQPTSTMGRCWKAIHGDAILKVAFITFLVLGILAAVVGGLVFAGKLGIALTGVGVMSQMVGLYTMIAGIGTVLLLILAACAKNYLCKKPQQPPAALGA